MNKGNYEFKTEDALRFANEHGHCQLRRKGKELQFEFCPYCHGGQNKDTYTFSINMINGQHSCFRSSCGIKGNMITLSKDFHFSLGEEADAYYNPEWKKYKKLIQEKYKPKPTAITYLESRKISKAITEQYGITAKPDSDNILIFPFRDEKDILQFVKYRNTTYKKGDSGNKEWCEADCKPILFGMAQCDTEKSKTLIMTEGQIDSLSVAEAGFINAVSVPTGKNGFTWVRHCWDFLNRFDTLIVFGDHENGEITLLDEMKIRFNGIVKHVRPEDYKDCKDANEILQKYGKEQIAKCINNAVNVPIDAVMRMGDVKRVNPQDIEKLPTGIKTIDDALHGGLTFGNVHILGGKRGDGKSTFGSQIIASALQHNYFCFLYSGELSNWNVRAWLDYQLAGEEHITKNYYDSEHKIVKNWFVPNTYLDAIGEWYQDRCFIYDGESIKDDEREDLLKTVEEVIKQNIRVVLLDNLMTALDLSLDHNSDKYEKQSHFVKRLALLAKRYNACIILVAHRRKGNTNDSSDSNDEISGSGDITNLAGIVLSYDRFSDREKKEGKGNDKDRKLIIAKERLFGNVNFKGITLHYEPFSKRIYETEDEKTMKYGWWDNFSRTNTDDIPEGEEINPFA
jgi:KaiC/GvpD/RAD55 family RecA-like ATPase